MFSDFDSDDFANLGKVAGIALFVIAFLLPAVHAGPNNYWGFVCAGWTLSFTVGFFVKLFGPDGPDGFGFFFMISGWISPLVAFGIFSKSEKVKRRLALMIPILLLTPWIVFAWPQSGWGAVEIRPTVGHYLWTAGCLLTFTPQYLTLIGITKSTEQSRDEQRESDPNSSQV